MAKAKKKSEAKSLKSKIKEMENKKREETIVKQPAEKKVSFDSWYHQRKIHMAKHHMKEIIYADFKARGLGKEATMAEYDKALEQYGIKLK